MEHIVVLTDRYKAQLYDVREMAGLKVGVQAENIWLRGIHITDQQSALLRALPAEAIYLADEEDRLFPETGTTPVARLPRLDWVPIKTFLPLRMPVSVLPSAINDKITLRLSQSSIEMPGFALLVPLTYWKAYAETAPETRLRVLQFAVSGTGEALITGNPLPPLTGQFYWNYGNLLIPAGYHFELPIIADLVIGLLPAQDNFILFNTDGSFQQIAKSVFQPAARSAVRLTNITNV